MTHASTSSELFPARQTISHRTRTEEKIVTWKKTKTKPKHNNKGKEKQAKNNKEHNTLTIEKRKRGRCHDAHNIR
jgi:hypothetical protein